LNEGARERLRGATDVDPQFAKTDFVLGGVVGARANPKGC
jgi:hypothetical protein